MKTAPLPLLHVLLRMPATLSLMVFLRVCFPFAIGAETTGESLRPSDSEFIQELPLASEGATFKLGIYPKGGEEGPTDELYFAGNEVSYLGRAALVRTRSGAEQEVGLFVEVRVREGPREQEGKKDAGGNFVANSNYSTALTRFYFGFLRHIPSALNISFKDPDRGLHSLVDFTLQPGDQPEKPRGIAETGDSALASHWYFDAPEHYAKLTLREIVALVQTDKKLTLVPLAIANPEKPNDEIEPGPIPPALVELLKKEPARPNPLSENFWTLLKTHTVLDPGVESTK